MSTANIKDWTSHVIKQDEIDKYLINGKDFIDESIIFNQLKDGQNPSNEKIKDILQKSLDIKRLNPDETAALLNVQDPKMWEEIFATALEVKKRVYDNRIVFFAPLYCSNYCVNNCAYCGFREKNTAEKRRILSMDEIVRETQAVIDEGHKRVIVVFGEHPKSDADYMAEAIRTIYSVERPAKTGKGNIRRVNVNAAPMSIADLKKLWSAGIGTYQVFQETYHKATYGSMHPANTLKGNYKWRLYALHRAMDAGIDDVAIGSLFGLYDWRFEVMGLLYHAIDLETQFNIGPHTISFPRMNAALGSDVSTNSNHLVSDADFKKLVAVLRLSVSYAGLIITARERAELRKEIIQVGCTQTDASTKIGIGAYSERYSEQEKERQQFLLGDTRSLDEVVKELAEMGIITSFCTAGYRCGRTGDKIMGLLKGCTEGKYCKLNAVLTFREYLDDYASPETKIIGERLIHKEIEETKNIPFFTKHHLINTFDDSYKKIQEGERDIYI